jgi:hypothetical protein
LGNAVMDQYHEHLPLRERKPVMSSESVIRERAVAGAYRARTLPSSLPMESRLGRCGGATSVDLAEVNQNGAKACGSAKAG